MGDRIRQLRLNIESVRSRIAEAATKAQRDVESVTLVAVTKYVHADVVRDLINLGCNDLGESRPQAFWSKAESLSDLDVRWHQIGHLQRNKLKRTLPLSHLIHSVDSLRLLHAIDETQRQLSPAAQQSILLEVNISGDESKHGFPAANIDEAIEIAASLNNIDLRGLMGMAGYGTSPEQAQRDFAKLRQLQHSLLQRYSDIPLPELSMGMSGDFEQAIAEGATLVRVGSALYEGL